MTKDLDFKRLSKDMSLQDKAKILFADIGKRAEGFGRLLTPGEKQAIVEDAVKNKQMEELNRLKKTYDLGTLLIIEARVAFLNFKLALSVLSAFLIAITIKTTNDNIINQIIYDLAVSKETDEEKTNKLFNELDKKYKDNKTLNQYDLFTPPLINPDDYLKTSPNMLPEPNIFLQEALMETVNKLKEYKLIRYQLEYVVKNLMGIDFLSDGQKQRLVEHDKVIAGFIGLDEVFAIIKVFSDFEEKAIIRTTSLAEPKFLETIKDINKAVELTEEDKKKTEEYIDHMLLFNG